MKHTEQTVNNILNVYLIGQLTYKDHGIFTSLLNNKNTNKIEIVLINLEGIENAQTGSLNNFELLKELTDENQITLILKSPNEQLQKKLYLADFYKLFNIID